MALRESGEMYLETILLLKSRASVVHAVDIAEELNYAKSSVSRGVNILKNRGYITVAKDGEIELTEQGRALANKTYQRHRILTEFFIGIGVSKEVAENDACRIEHVISDETLQKIKDNTNK